MAALEKLGIGEIGRAGKAASWLSSMHKGRQQGAVKTEVPSEASHEQVKWLVRLEVNAVIAAFCSYCRAATYPKSTTGMHHEVQAPITPTTPNVRTHFDPSTKIGCTERREKQNNACHPTTVSCELRSCRDTDMLCLLCAQPNANPLRSEPQRPGSSDPKCLGLAWRWPVVVIP